MSGQRPLKAGCKRMVPKCAKLMGMSGMLLILLKRGSVGKKCCQNTWKRHFCAILRRPTNKSTGCKAARQVGLDSNSDQASRCMYVSELCGI